MFSSKEQLLADLETRVLRVVAVNKQDDPVKETVNINTYLANVLNIEQGSVQGQNVVFYVLDEGTASEQAYYQNRPGSRKELEVEAVAFLKTLPYVRVSVEQVDSNNEFVIVRAFKENADETLSEVKVMIYKDGDTPMHKEIT